MISDRVNFIKIVNTAFQDTKKKQQLLSIAELALTDNGSAKRLFDHFPPLLSDEEFQVLMNGFINLVEVVKPQRDGEGVPRITNQDDQALISCWLKGIAVIAGEELLDEKGEIKEKIKELFKWENVSQPRIVSFLDAYIGAINQEITVRLANQQEKEKKFGFEKIEDTQRLDDIRTAIFLLINQRYGIWTVEVLKEQGKVFDPRALAAIDRSQPIDIIHWPTLKTVGVLAGGIAIMAGLVVGGLHLYSAYVKSTKQSNDNEDKLRRRVQP